MDGNHPTFLKSGYIQMMKSAYQCMLLVKHSDKLSNEFIKCFQDLAVILNNEDDTDDENDEDDSNSEPREESNGV
jgi:hypothetical protein